MKHLLFIVLLLNPSVLFAVEAITLHQTACQFVEAEGGDKAYQANTYAACKTLNAKTGKQRVQKANVLRLKEGVYKIRVFNDDVPYVLGFWLRGVGLARLTLPSTSGGGIQTGGYKDYQIKLKAGEYVYSCPLNPTPDYKLVVTP
ncbi:hypothetical protein [Ghiorsea bivora]|uniref:hypothetical protein n=1 Tax=Ghiorsea bivora TaxID=1485545 RepID=UPI00056FCE73|nr:hypothetical protein [Ghiorsea bivora]